MSKSRSGKTPSSNQNAPPTTVQNAIIPGKFFESDWNELLEIEDDENFISDIIDEITDAACNQVYDNIIGSRVLPHTVLSVRELLLDIIDWNFLANDPGESNTETKLSWIEDDEPNESVIDNWAQGAVPKKEKVELENIPEEPSDKCVQEITTEIEKLIVTEDKKESLLDYIVNNEHIEESYTTTATDVADQMSSLTIEESDSQIDSTTTETSKEYVVDHIRPEEIERSVEKPKVKKKTKRYRPHNGSLPTFEKISLDSVTDLRPKPGTDVPYQSNTLNPSAQYQVKSQYGRASGPKEIIYDERGQVIKVEKLNVAHFPKHRVPVKYSIIDSESEATTQQKKSTRKNTNQQTAEKSLRNRNRISAKTLLEKIQPSGSMMTNGYVDINHNFSSNHMQYTLQARSPLPPLMVDSINVADGVTVRQGGLSKQVVKKTTQETSVGQRTMYPISTTTNNKILEVKDIVAEKSPTFRYIGVPESIAGM